MSQQQLLSSGQSVVRSASSSCTRYVLCSTALCAWLLSTTLAAGQEPTAAPSAVTTAPTPPPTGQLAPVEPAPAAPAIVEPPPIVEPAPVVEPPPTEEKDWTKHLTLGGGAILWYYEPFLPGGKSNVSFFHVRLNIDAHAGDFGFRAQPRVRDNKIRGFYDSSVWLEEAYGYWNASPYATIKVGKVYSQLGLFWDNSFYGNVQVYDGLKLAPEYGASLEGVAGGDFGISYWAQYFIVDGRTNVSLDQRDTLSIPGARRRNQIVLNAEPFYKLGEHGALRAGVSLQYLEADLPTEDSDVLRVAGHAKVTYEGFGVWGEVLHQGGNHVTDFPYAGRPSSDNLYFLAGAEYTYDRFTLRYNVSYANYADVDVSEVMHVPALAIAIAEPLTFLTELVLWRRSTPEGDLDVDKSLNVLLLASF